MKNKTSDIINVVLLTVVSWLSVSFILQVNWSLTTTINITQSIPRIYTYLLPVTIILLKCSTSVIFRHNDYIYGYGLYHFTA